MSAEPVLRQSPWRAIFIGGLIAGTVDIGMAAWINWLDPRTILHFIAGGVLGGAALQDGAGASILGIMLQWGMSIVIAAAFVITAYRIAWLTRKPLRAGVAYGVIVFVVMNYVVMPLSAWHRINRFTPGRLAENLAAMVLFGLIIATVTRRFVRCRRDHAL